MSNKDALPPKERVNPYRLIQNSVVQNENGVTVTSDGTACVVGFQAFKIKKGQRLFHNSKASMGYELPQQWIIWSNKEKVFVLQGWINNDESSGAIIHR